MAGNQGKYQNFDPFLIPKNLWLMKQKKNLNKKKFKMADSKKLSFSKSTSLTPCWSQLVFWNIHFGIQFKLGLKFSYKLTEKKIQYQLKSVHFKKPVTRSSFLSKSVVIFNITTTNMTTLFERNENRVTGFLKWTDFIWFFFSVLTEFFFQF